MGSNSNAGLASLGVACIVAAVVGGGVKMAGNEIPVLDNLLVQIALIVVGSVLLWGSGTLPGSVVSVLGAFLIVIVVLVGLGLGGNSTSPVPTAGSGSTSTVDHSDPTPTPTRVPPTVVEPTSVCDDLNVTIVRIELLGSNPISGDVWGVTVRLANSGSRVAELPGVDGVQFTTSTGMLVQPFTLPPPEFPDPWFFKFDLPPGTTAETQVLVGSDAPSISRIMIDDIGDGQRSSSCTATN